MRVSVRGLDFDIETYPNVVRTKCPRCGAAIEHNAKSGDARLNDARVAIEEHFVSGEHSTAIRKSTQI